MATPLFILSFRHRDELSGLAEQAGWQPIAARRSQNAEGRFVGSGAAVAVVDARGALDEGKEAVRAIADAVEANAGALLVLLSRGDSAALDLLHQLGATHFLVSPFTEGQFLSALKYAARHAERVGGGLRGRRSGTGGDTASWRWEPGSRTIELSPALVRQAGFGEEGAARIPLIELFRKLDAKGRRAARLAIERTVASGTPSAFAHDAPSTAEGRIAHHVRTEGGAVIGRAEAIGTGDAVASATRDPLTGLADGRAARTWVSERLGRGQKVELILVSVNRYDAINAAFGRRTGDAVLQAVGRRIERQVSPDGRTRLIARMAGAEFAVLLADPATPNEGRFLAGELVQAVGRPFASDDQVVTLGAKAGVAASQDGDDPAALLRRASAALAEARSGERAPVQMLGADGEAGQALAERLEVDLRRALAEDEIEIRYQPQVSITDGRVTGVEALARWRHPELGELGAGMLFDVAERSDYLVQLSDHVQHRALAAAVAWPESLAHLRLSVNVTAADIARPGFSEQFLQMVKASGFPPERLTVEVTESGLIDDLGGAGNLLAELRAGGLRIAIDDFGTGYSSLAYLKALPLDYLKIDKRLSDDIGGSARDRIVVRSVIDMARSLGLTVIAEGVETEEQLGLLAQEGCNLYQGFLCAPPLNVAELAALIGSSSPRA